MIDISLEKNINENILILLQLVSKKNKVWKNKLNQIKEFIPYSIHLAILNQPYINFILEGKKTIESRFSVNKTIPFQRVKKEDIILLKLSSGNVLGLCEVKDACFYELNSEIWKYIKEKLAQSLCINDDVFWIEKEQKSRYASLIQVQNPTIFDQEIIYRKKDRRGWIIIHNYERKKNKGLDQFL